MRIIKFKKTDNGKVLDLPDGEQIPHVDYKNVFGVHTTDNECIIFESEEEIPEHLRYRPQLHVLRDFPDDMILWRYMDFPRLYSLIKKESLFFTPACVLRESDPYEFRLPVQQLMVMRDFWKKLREDQFLNDARGRQRASEIDRMSEDGRMYDQGISCWHINNNENNALWSIYVPNGGVAIKTTLGRLKSSLEYKGRYIYADSVEYIDYYSENYKPHPSATGFEQMFHKAKFFEYEKEFRIALQFNQTLVQFGYGSARLIDEYETLEEMEISRAAMKARGEEFLNKNAFVPVNLADLIAEVVVGPKLEPWYHDLVVNLVRPVVSQDVSIRSSAIGHWQHV